MTQGYNAVLVVVDRLIKYAYSLSLRHPFDAFSVTIVFTKVIVKLHGFLRVKPKSWAKWLHWVEYSYNTAPHLSTKISTFKALYGREAPPILRMDRGQATVNSIEEMLLERDYILSQ
ncbi:uncharacterized protein LOC141689588 [Apium graveolens]|uniref:uncharacterized protein LOC141689588 n=1 Tax=Apium graveolens TaxID=4045 RepID=UPI003D79ACA4